MPPRKPSSVGAHVFVAGGLSSAGLPYAERIGAEAVQVFVSNPRGWAASPGDPATDEAFRSSCADRRMPVFVHAPYLCNFGSPTEATRDKTASAVAHSLARGRRIGARGVVVHTGSAVDAGARDVALKTMRELVLPLLDELGDDDPMLLVEPTAGGGQPLAATVGDLAPLFDALEFHPRLGVCLDTCHAWAAGHDLATPGGVRSTLNALVRAVGRGRLGLIHANDSKDGLGSGRDRHTNIGAGMIGVEPFAELFRHPATRNVPVVVETPGDVQAHQRDLATLKSLRDR
ncbi:MAG TPA: deoxyribonuclease IV [Mycobacteriales bacterium]|nr:deoxyribonuclease IV [Mycobacteriales bacterium]